MVHRRAKGGTGREGQRFEVTCHATGVLMTVIQLNPPLPMETPKGAGLAHFMIDYGPESHLMWTVFLDASGECWTFQNPEIRAAKNISLGRTTLSTIRPMGKQNGVAVDSPAPAADGAISAGDGQVAHAANGVGGKPLNGFHG